MHEYLHQYPLQITFVGGVDLMPRAVPQLTTATVDDRAFSLDDNVALVKQRLEVGKVEDSRHT